MCPEAKRLTRLITALVLAGTLLSGCSKDPKIPALTLSSVDGTIIELDENTPMTALLFFSMSNPVALGALDRLPQDLNDAADSVAIALHVDRPPNVAYLQQRTLVPIVIDETHRIAAAFGGVDLTPTLILVNKGRILHRQRGQLDYTAINRIVTEQLSLP